jgi:hypothetical protein
MSPSGTLNAALPPGGALIVYERLIDDDRSASAAGLLSSLNMLIKSGESARPAEFYSAHAE